MTRETKDQRKVREAQEQAATESAMDEYYKTLPKRLFDAQCLASMLPGLTVSTTLSESGPRIRFYKDKIDVTLTYQSEEWEIDWLEDKLRAMKTEINAKESRRKRAKEILDGLSVEDRIAIKEHILII